MGRRECANVIYLYLFAVLLEASQSTHIAVELPSHAQGVNMFVCLCRSGEAGQKFTAVSAPHVHTPHQPPPPPTLSTPTCGHVPVVAYDGGLLCQMD